MVAAQTCPLLTIVCQAKLKDTSHKKYVWNFIWMARVCCAFWADHHRAFSFLQLTLFMLVLKNIMFQNVEYPFCPWLIMTSSFAAVGCKSVCLIAVFEWRLFCFLSLLGEGSLINILFYVVPFCMVTGWNGFVFLILIIRIWNFAWWKYLKEVCGNTISKSLWVALNLKIASVYIESTFWSKWFIWSVFLPLCLFVCFIIIKKSCLMWFSIYITMRERKRNQLVGKLFFNPKNTWYQFV